MEKYQTTFRHNLDTEDEIRDCGGETLFNTPKYIYSFNFYLHTRFHLMKVTFETPEYIRTYNIEKKCYVIQYIY